MEEIYEIKLSRSDIYNLMVACTIREFEFDVGSIGAIKWKTLHSKLQSQIETIDKNKNISAM